VDQKEGLPATFQKSPYHPAVIPGTSKGENPAVGNVPEAWSEPVDTRVLLTEVIAQLRRYIVVPDDDALAIALWVMFAWVHNEIAVHSTLLVFNSAEPDEGKTTAANVLMYLTPRGHSAAELTGPTLFRFVDHVKPTLSIDDADKLLKRKPDLTHIVNVGWTRGTLIPRQDRGITHWFDPFCPKIIAGVKLGLDKTTWSRAITIKLKRKLETERVEDFNQVDDDTFLTLRRKLVRWAIDDAEALKAARPCLPSGFTNRLRMNWLLLFAIADLAGG
jgi:putative DNA primase/helicase